MKFLYSAWFRDLRLPPDDEDFEWPACFVIQADSEKAAKKWGDHLAMKRSVTSGEPFLSSKAEPVESPTPANVACLPHIVEGQEVTDTEIGW